MQDERKTKEQLLAELLEVNECVAAIEAAEAELHRAAHMLWLTQCSVHQLESKILSPAGQGAARSGATPR